MAFQRKFHTILVNIKDYTTQEQDKTQGARDNEIGCHLEISGSVQQATGVMAIDSSITEFRLGKIHIGGFLSIVRSYTAYCDDYLICL